MLQQQKVSQTFLIGDEITFVLKEGKVIGGIIGQITQDGNITLVNGQGIVRKKLNTNDIKIIKKGLIKYHITDKYKLSVLERIPVVSLKDEKGHGILKILALIILIPLGVLAGLWLFALSIF